MGGTLDSAGWAAAGWEAAGWAAAGWEAAGWAAAGWEAAGWAAAGWEAAGWEAAGWEAAGGTTGTTGTEVGWADEVAGATVELTKVTGFSSHRVQTVVWVRVMVLVRVTGTTEVMVPLVTVDDSTGIGQ